MARTKKKQASEDQNNLIEDEDVIDSNNKTIDVAIKALRKKYGNDVVSWLNSRKVEDRKIISTGSLGLDNALGVGGFVRGRIYEVYGPHSSGKTTLTLSAIRQVQKNGGIAAFVDAEHTLSTDLMLSMGIDLSKVVVVQGYTAEDNLDLAKTLIGTGDFDICVIDSISALQPAAEANLDSYSDNTMGLHPRLMARMSRDLTPIVSRTKTSLLLINQIRSNIGRYGNPETTSGGNALQHHVTGKIRVSGGGLKSSQIKNHLGEVIGHRVSFEVTKNKLYAPFRTAEVDLIYGKGFHLSGEVVDLSVDTGLIDKRGAWFYYNDVQIGQGRDNTVAYVENNPEFMNELVGQLSNIVNDKKNEPAV